MLERDTWRTRAAAEAAVHSRVGARAAFAAGLFWCEDPREARQNLLAAGKSSKLTLSSPSQHSGLRLGATCEFVSCPMEHELLRRGARLNRSTGARLAGLAQVLSQITKAKRKVPTAAQRQEVAEGPVQRL